MSSCRRRVVRGGFRPNTSPYHWLPSYVAGHPGAAAMQLRAMIALAFSEKGDRWLIWPLAFPA